MKRIMIIFVVSIVFIGGIVGSLYMMSKTKPVPQAEVKNEIIISDRIKDECVDEFENMQIEEIDEVEAVNSSEIEKSNEEHYMLRDVDGKIVIYELDEEGNEYLLEKTEIPTEYLAEIDKINMANGLIVYGKESLNKLMEDFE